MKSVFVVTAAAAALLAGSASASTIYSNGPVNGTLNAWSIQAGIFDVADSFTASAGSVVNGMSFVSWDTPGYTLSTVTWAIYDGNPLNGSPTFLGGGTLAPTVTALGGSPNNYGKDLNSNSITFTGVDLTAGGTYWIELSGGNDGGGNVFWDENDGPSQAWQSGTGNLFGQSDPGLSGSETFTLFDSVGTPEPATWALMLAGFAGLGVALRSRRKLATA